MLGTLVENRIGDVPGLMSVGGAAGFAALKEGDTLRLPNRIPAAFVIVLGEQPGPDVRDIGAPVLQTVAYHVAVITVVKVANDRDGERTNAISDQIRDGIKAKLFGWVPDGFDFAFKRGPSGLLDFEAGAHWHQDEFITYKDEVPTNG